MTKQNSALGPAPLPTWHGEGCTCNQYPRKDCPALQTPEGQAKEKARELNSARCRLREAETRRREAGEEVRRLTRKLAELEGGPGERERRRKLCEEADATDFSIMRYAQQNPRVCCSNAPTGEVIQYGGRAQP